MSWGAVIGAGASLAGGLLAKNGSKQSGNQTVTQKTEIDPRIAEMLFGKEGGDGGLLARFQQTTAQPQSAGLLSYGQGADQYLGTGGLLDAAGLRDAARGLASGGITAPQAEPGRAIQPAGMERGVLWNTGESYSAPEPFKAASVAAPQQIKAGNLTAATVSPTAAYTPAMATASAVNAPAQNNLDLTSSYNRFVNGTPGANPYLTGAIGKGINQARNAFDAAGADSTRNLLETVLPSIRGGAIIAGGYGGSRQGIAEGRAVGDFARERERALSQFGQNATDAAVSAQAGAYDTDSNRALAATTGLGAQQYGVAQQDAAARNAVSMQNAGAANAAAAAKFGADVAGSQANAGYQQQAGLTKFGADMDAQRANQAAGLAANTTNAGLLQDAAKTAYAGDLSAAAGTAGLRQQANLANQQAGNAGSQFNASQIQNAETASAQLAQQRELANLQARLGTNSLNSANTATGISAGSGLLAGAYGTARDQDNYAMNRAAQESGLLAPYLSIGSSQSTTSPIYSNPGAGFLGGAAAGLGLYNQFKNLGGGGGSGSWGDIMSGWNAGTGY